MPGERLADYEFAGELALTGELRPIRGTLAMMYGASRDRRAFVVPHENAPEAALVEGAKVYAAHNLLEVCAHLAGREPLELCRDVPVTEREPVPDLADVKGQVHA